MSDMRIDGLGPIRYTPLGTPAAPPVEQPSFGDALKTALGDVNEMQLSAGELQRRMVAGEPVDLHEEMISSEEAGIAFDLMMEVRNKLLEAYQTIQRMQV